MPWYEATWTTTLPKGSWNRERKRGLRASRGQEARLGNMANICELLKLSLQLQMPKMLIGISPKRGVIGSQVEGAWYADKRSPVERQSLNCSLVTRKEHSKPVSSPRKLGRESRKSFLIEMQVKERGKSEGLFVMRRIKVET